MNQNIVTRISLFPVYYSCLLYTSFSPEMFKYIENADPMKQKQLAKGIDQLMDAGVAQLFINQFNGRKIIEMCIRDRYRRASSPSCARHGHIQLADKEMLSNPAAIGAHTILVSASATDKTEPAAGWAKAAC